jgi:hypothetical protein
MKSLTEFQKLLVKILVIGVTVTSFSGCAAPIVLAAVGFGTIGTIGGLSLLRHHEQPQPNLTPLEIQSLQTREYTASKEKVFSSMISVFQDLGYTISIVDSKSGLIQAKGLLNSSDHINAAAFVESEGNKTKIRLSFVKVIKISHRHRGVKKDSTQVLDATLYQNTFEHLESELFIRSSR